MSSAPVTSSPATSTRFPSTPSPTSRTGRGTSRLTALALALAACALLVAGAAACAGDSLAPHGSPATSTGPSTDAGAVVFWARPGMLADPVLGALAAEGSAATVRPVAYASGETILADLVAGRHADVVEVCSDESARRLAEQGLLQPLDTSRIAAWDRLYPVLKDLPGVVIDGEVYMVPVTAAVSGVVYDPRRIAAVPAAFRTVFAPRFAGRMAFRDDAALAFTVAALELGYDPAALTPSQAAEAEIFLKHHKEKYRSFWHDLDMLAGAFRSGHVALAVGSQATAEQLRRRGARVAFALAGEGQPLQTCGLAITAGARDLDAAYALIDHYLDAGTQALLAERSGELVSNRDAAPRVPASTRRRLSLTALADLERPVPLVPSLEHLDWIQDWYEVKKGRG
jgi:spermidine/putrescine transport system substrate-binding protein